MYFTFILVLLFLLIYISGRENKANKWCAFSGMFFCIGAFKEFYYYEMVPKLTIFFGNAVSQRQYTAAYSIMTSMLYYLSMPAAIIASFYFTNFSMRKRRIFKWYSIFIFISPLIISLFYNPKLTAFYQLNDNIYWYVVSIYNVFYGIIVTIFLILNVIRDKNDATKRQKKLVIYILLPALWYWLITVFIIRSLGIKSLYGLWKGNIAIISVVIVFYVVMAFKEGIMGLRLKKENYNWNTDRKIKNKNTSYVRHLIKNETTKIEWCITRLESMYGEETPEEIDIINRSIMHLKDFMEKTKQYSSEITLEKKHYYVNDVINESISLMKGYIGENIKINVKCHEDIMLICDKTHMVEVLNNLISNSVEAMNGMGTINIDTCFDHRRKHFNISVKDSGKGIDKKDIPYIFNPFYTTKNSNKNFGLGLSYCSNVMKVHKGYIDIKSLQENGVAAVLHFPAKYVTKGENINYEENKSTVCRG